MHILICSQYGEVQVDETSKLLETKGIKPVLFERYRKDQFVSYYYNKSGIGGILRIGNEEYVINSKTFPVIWYRTKPVIIGEIPGEIGKVEQKFCAHEWREAMHALDVFLPDSHWINRIGDSLRASNKIIQLKYAKEVGLATPQTIITNDAMSALKLFNKSRVIYKTLSSFFSMTHAIYTNEINEKQIVEHRNAIAMAPGIFQGLIEKEYELRITVIGEKMFIARINSQLQQESSIDWRKKACENMYEEGWLSENTKSKLLRFHRLLGLTYAAYDFIVDKLGNEIFIECNPSGQWLWLENKLNVTISELMADELINSLH